MSLFLFIISCPAALICCALMANEAKPKKNIMIGVTLPHTARDDERVKKICAEYRRNIYIIAAAVTALMAGVFPVRWMSVQLCIIFAGIIVLVAAMLLIFARANKRLHALKRAEGWRLPSSGEVVVDLGGKAAPRGPISRWWFMPALVVSLIPCGMAFASYSGKELLTWLIVPGSMAAIVLMSILIYPLVFRQRKDVVDGDAEVNSALTNVRRYNWGKAWIGIAWLSALLGLALWLCRENEWWVLASTCVYTVALLLLATRTELVTRGAQERLTAMSGLADYVDEDDYWLWGLFYYNPNDRRTAVNERVGMNMSFNLARPVGKATMGLAALCIAAMPLLCTWLVAVEFTPREAEIVDGVCVVEHVTERFSVPLEEVNSAGLIYELPEARRTNGVGMDTLLEGRFSVEGYGRSLLCLNPELPPFIVLETDGETYIFGLMTPEETEALYTEIRSAINA